MKKLSGSTGRFLIITTFLFAILLISDSCNKSSYNSMTGMTGGTYGTGGGGSGTPGLNQVFIQNMSFNPSTIMVSTGTTITWTNKDAIDHTVTSDTGLFTSAYIGPNGTYSYTFMTAGTYSYHCQIHSGMTASVSVSVPAAPPTNSGY
jgi:plastocyanin